jgi:hypothetical protein
VGGGRCWVVVYSLGFRVRHRYEWALHVIIHEAGFIK